MGTERFNVVLDGLTLDGAAVATVAPELAKLIKRDNEFAAALLQGKPTKIKSGVDAAAGARYVDALQRIGVAVCLIPETLKVDADIVPPAMGSDGPMAKPSKAPAPPSRRAQGPAADQTEEARSFGLSDDEIDHLGIPIKAIRYLAKYGVSEKMVSDAIMAGKIRAVIRREVLWVEDKPLGTTAVRATAAAQANVGVEAPIAKAQEARVKRLLSWPNLLLLLVFLLAWMDSHAKYHAAYYSIGVAIGVSAIPLVIGLIWNVVNRDWPIFKWIYVGASILMIVLLFTSQLQVMKEMRSQGGPGTEAPRGGGDPPT